MKRAIAYLETMKWLYRLTGRSLPRIKVVTAAMNARQLANRRAMSNA